MSIAYLPENTTTVPFLEIARLIADAKYPDGQNNESPNHSDWYICIRWSMNHLQVDADSGTLKIRDKYTGNVIQLAGDKLGMLEFVVVAVRDLKPYLADREITLVVGLPVVGPTATTPKSEITEPVPAAVVTSAVIHSTKARRNLLTPVIEFAQAQCRNPLDTAEVWAFMQVLAEKKHAPLIGGTEDGLQYLVAGNVKIFNRKLLHQRLNR